MSIRKPIKIATLLDTGDVGAGSVAGGVAKTFNLPQDTDNVVMKVTSSLVGTSVSAVLQTTDDGGSTWYDVARSKLVTVSNNTIADWTSVPVIGFGQKTTIINGTIASVGGQPAASIGGTTGSAAASTIGAGQFSGLPIMDTYNRVFIIYTGNVTTNDLVKVDIYANNQSNRA